MTDYTFETPDPIDLEVRLGSSDIDITATERADTYVRVTPTDGDEDSATDRVRVECHGHRVVIEEVHGVGGLRRNRGRYDIRVELPSGSAVAVTVGSGDVTTRGLIGSLRAKTGSGDLHVDECGPAQVLVGSGDIDIASALNGAVVKSGSGDVVVRSACAGEFDFTTGSGDVRCGIPEGVAAELDMKSGLGSIENRLSSSESKPEASTYIRVRAKTGSGDIVIERAIGTALH